LLHPLLIPRRDTLRPIPGNLNFWHSTHNRVAGGAVFEGVDNRYSLANLTAAYRRLLENPIRRRRLPSGCSPEDLLHDAVLEILERPGPQGGDRLPTDELESWLRRSLHFRRLAAWRKHPALASIEDVGELELVSEQRGPLSTLCAREMCMGVRSALLALSPSHREVLALRVLGWVDGTKPPRPNGGASPRAIRQRLVRARSNLRRALRERSTR
jgi:DNA-directed RNA polymerase specialized sigma24 family protein